VQLFQPLQLCWVNCSAGRAVMECALQLDAYTETKYPVKIDLY